VHIVSDVHGEHKKLQHILNNASGSLRPLVETLLGSDSMLTISSVCSISSIIRRRCFSISTS
jgi:fructose-1,6-bisphosphatase